MRHHSDLLKPLLSARDSKPECARRPSALRFKGTAFPF
jgi:hypothetical protein